MFGLAAPVLAQSSFESTYTSVEPEHCRTIPSAAGRTPETGGPEQHLMTCPGVFTYALQVEESERPYVTVVTPDKTESRLHLLPYASGFSTLGPRAEWRVARIDNRQQPTALILRINEATDPSQLPMPPISRLVVSRVSANGQACVVGAVPPGAQQNELARQMADRARTMPCIRED